MRLGQLALTEPAQAAELRLSEPRNLNCDFVADRMVFICFSLSSLTMFSDSAVSSLASSGCSTQPHDTFDETVDYGSGRDGRGTAGGRYPSPMPARRRTGT